VKIATTMNRIVDASVVLKWLLAEDGAEQAAELMRQPLIAPDSLVPECINGLRKRVARGMLDPEDAELAAELLRRTGIVFEPTQPLATEILRLSVRLSWPAYDCAYLALACRHDGVVVTADHRFIARCRRPDSPDLFHRVRSLFEEFPMVQERPVRPYIARRRAA
jgi:predicted nucleic acid-binding protein